MKKKTRKIYVVGSSKEYTNWMQGELVDNMKDADLVVFTGGEDVDPSLYNEPKHKTAHNNFNRDKEETLAFLMAKGMNKKMIGICRGAQFLCVQAGGLLVQDQNNPFYIHPIETYDGQTIKITSTHHQAQLPYYLRDDEYKLIAWSKNLSKYHKNGWDTEVELKDGKEAEIVYYPKINALGIQGHPEYSCMMSEKHSKDMEYLTNLLDKFINDSTKLL